MRKHDLIKHHNVAKHWEFYHTAMVHGASSPELEIFKPGMSMETKLDAALATCPSFLGKWVLDTPKYIVIIFKHDARFVRVHRRDTVMYELCRGHDCFETNGTMNTVYADRSPSNLCMQRRKTGKKPCVGIPDIPAFVKRIEGKHKAIMDQAGPGVLYTEDLLLFSSSASKNDMETSLGAWAIFFTEAELLGFNCTIAREVLAKDANSHMRSTLASVVYPPLLHELEQELRRSDTLAYLENT
jgi:hypothetical protein